MLFAIGRKPLTESLDLTTTGIETNKNGHIAVGDDSATEVEGVYAVDLKEVAPDPTLKKVVEHCRSAADRYVFTASPREHAERCLKRLGLRGLFNSIVDVRCCELNTKHASRSFDRAMLAAGCGGCNCAGGAAGSWHGGTAGRDRSLLYCHIGVTGVGGTRRARERGPSR